MRERDAARAGRVGATATEGTAVRFVGAVVRTDLRETTRFRGIGAFARGRSNASVATYFFWWHSHGDSTGRLDLRPRSRAAAAGESFWRAVAGRFRPGGPNRCRRRSGRNSVLRALDPARLARPRGPHRLVRATK